MKYFDIIIIGSGGGSKITRPAANLGYSVAIIEKGPLGGTCLNRGCIPSKMLIHAADIIHEINDAKRHNIHINQPPSVDVKELATRVNTVVQKESHSIEPLYEKHPNVSLFSGEAHFINNNTLQVGDQTLQGKKIFIAAGARPHIPTIDGLKSTPFWTSTEALTATKAPKSMVIIGAGYIACELGYYFQALGTQVNFLVRSELLRPEDTDIKEEFHTAFSKHHDIIKPATPTKISHQNNTFTIQYTHENTQKTITSESLLIATGITPNTDTLKLENTDIKQTENNFIQVNDYLETSVKDVYAFGDIIGRYQFRHSVNFEGEYLFNTKVKDPINTPINYPPVPHAIFTNPQVAGVGVTEKTCQQENIPYYTGKNAYKDSAMGMALQSEEGFAKLLFHKKTNALIGAHIIGKEASNMIHMLILAITMNATHEDLLSMIYIHPALPEVIRNAVRNASAS